MSPRRLSFVDNTRFKHIAPAAGLAATAAGYHDIEMPSTRGMHRRSWISSGRIGAFKWPAIDEEQSDNVCRNQFGSLRLASTNGNAITYTSAPDPPVAVGGTMTRATYLANTKKRAIDCLPDRMAAAMSFLADIKASHGEKWELYPPHHMAETQCLMHSVFDKTSIVGFM